MKANTLLLLVLSTLLLTGCETYQLTIEQDGPKLASALGVKTSDILFLSKCEFGRFNPNFRPGRAGIAFPPDRVISQHGIIAITESDISFLNEDRRLLSTQRISNFHGVAKRENQIQLHNNGRLIVAELAPASSRQLTREKHDTLYQMLLGKGVPEKEAPKTYVMQLDSRSKWSEHGPVMRAYPRASPNGRKSQASQSQ